MLNGVLNRHLGSLLGRLAVLQVILVLGVLQFFGGRTPMGMGPGGLAADGQGRPPDRDLVGAQGGKAECLGSLEMILQAAIQVFRDEHDSNLASFAQNGDSALVTVQSQE